MNLPSQPDDSAAQKYSPLEVISFENKLSELLLGVGIKMAGKIKSWQPMSDDQFVHRRDRTSNDLHLFLELKDGKFFHLRAYTRYMLDTRSAGADKVFLTGYQKDTVAQTGGVHSLKQDWYSWDSEAICQEILRQNPGLF